MMREGGGGQKVIFYDKMYFLVVQTGFSQQRVASLVHYNFQGLFEPLWFFFNKFSYKSKRRYEFKKKYILFLIYWSHWWGKKYLIFINSPLTLETFLCLALEIFLSGDVDQNKNIFWIIILYTEKD